MASLYWQPKQKSTKQVNTITPANVGIGNTFTVTVNSKAYTFTATATTVANVTAGLVALLTASTEPEFTEITWADATTAITATRTTNDGKPFTQSSSASGGTATLVTATTTANQSKNDVNDVANYSTGALPANTNDLYFSATDLPAKWNLGSLSGVTLTSLNVLNSFAADCGLPQLNVDGTEYSEYRPDYFVIGSTTTNFGDFSGTGSGRFKLDNSSIQTTLNIFNTGTPAESDKPALIWKGTHASNAVNLENGSFGAAVYGSEVATISAMKVNNGTCFLGAGCTLTTVTQAGGTIDSASAITTLTQAGGSHVHRAGAITTPTVNGGTLDLRYGGAATLTTLTVGPSGVLDLTNCAGTVTVTNATFKGGATIIDPADRLVFTNPFSCPNGFGSITFIRSTASLNVQFS